jgi:TP901 family phage tail tape measure protein
MASSLIADLMVRFRADVATANRQIRSVNTALESAQRATGSATKQHAAHAAALNRSGQAAAQAARGQKQLLPVLGQTGRDSQIAARNIGLLGARALETSKHVGTTTGRLSGLRSSLGGVRSSMASAVGGAGAFRSRMGEVLNVLTPTSAMAYQAGASLGGGAVAGGGLAFGLYQAGKAAVRFESDFAGVAKTFPGTEAQLQGVRRELRDMATEIPTTTTELTGIGEAAGQLGIKASAVTDFTETIAMLNETSNLVGEEGATALARFANITQMPQDQFDELASTIVELGNKMASTEAEIAEFGLRIAGAGAQAGFSEGEILAVGAALSSVGIEAEAGGTAISRTMIEIAMAADAGGSEIAGFARVAGVSAKQFTEQWQRDPAAALVAFVEGLGRVEEQGGSTFATLEQLGITEQRQRDALLRAAGAGDLLRTALQLQNVEWREADALTNEFGKRLATTDSQIQIAKNSIGDLAVTIGQKLLPATRAGSNWVADFFKTLSDFIEGRDTGKGWLDWIPSGDELGSKGRALWKDFLPGLPLIDKFTRDASRGMEEVADASREVEHSGAAAAARVAEAGAAAAKTAPQMEGLGEELVELSDAQKQVNEAIASFTEPLAVYQNLLTAKGDAERQAAEETAASTKSSKDSWEDYAGKVDLSLSEIADALQKQLRAQAEWETNLVKVASRTSTDVAMFLAQMGEEGVDLTAKMAEGTDAEVRRMERLILKDMRNGSEDQVTELEKRMATMQGIVKKGGKAVVDGMGNELKLGTRKVAQITAEYAEALAKGLNPVILSIGGKPIVFGSASDARFAGRYARRNAGGPIPGSGPDRDSVWVHATPDEHMWTRSEVKAAGGHEAMYAMRKAALRGELQALNVGGVVGAGRSRLNPTFLRNFTIWSNWLQKQGTVPGGLNITSGWRSRAQQAALYAAKPGLAAPPGKSNHEDGLAIDHNPWSWAWNNTAGRFGMHHPMSYEGWHVEPTNLRDLSAMLKMPNLPGVPDFPYNGIARSAHQTARHTRKAAQAYLEANVLSALSPVGVDMGTSGSIQQMAQEMLRDRGWASQWGALRTLVQKESSWNPTAQNPSSTAYGLFQFLDSTWSGVGARKTSDPAAQIRAGLAYIANRYGSPGSAVAFHNAHGWYDRGGILRPGTSVATNATGKNEVVAAHGMIRAEVSAALEDLVVRSRRESKLQSRLDRLADKLEDFEKSLARREARGERRGLGRELGNLREETRNERARLAKELKKADTPADRKRIRGERRQLERDYRGERQDIQLQQRDMREQKRIDLWQRQIDKLDEAIAAEQEYISKLQDHIDTARSSFDDQVGTLNGMLDEYDRAQQQIADARKRYDEQAVEAERRFNDRRAELAAEYESRVSDLLAGRREELRRWIALDQMPGGGTLEDTAAAIEDLLAQLTGAGLSESSVDLMRQRGGAGGLIDSVTAQTAQARQWREGLASLRSRGVSEEVFAGFDLNSSPEMLDTVRKLVNATDEELRSLNEAVAARNAEIDVRVAEEQRLRLGALGESLVEARRAYDEGMRAAQEQFHADMAAAQQALSEELDAAREQLAAIGQDTGRDWSQAIADGIATRLPAILEQVAKVRAALAQLQSAEKTLDKAKGGPGKASTVGPAFTSDVPRPPASQRYVNGKRTPAYEKYLRSVGLHSGGIALARPGGVFANLGERGRDEAVIPLPTGWQQAVGDLVTGKVGNKTYNINIDARGAQRGVGAEIKQAVREALDETDRDMYRDLVASGIGGR